MISSDSEDTSDTEPSSSFDRFRPDGLGIPFKLPNRPSRSRREPERFGTVADGQCKLKHQKQSSLSSSVVANDDSATLSPEAKRARVCDDTSSLHCGVKEETSDDSIISRKSGEQESSCTEFCDLWQTNNMDLIEKLPQLDTNMKISPKACKDCGSEYLRLSTHQCHPRCLPYSSTMPHSSHADPNDAKMSFSQETINELNPTDYEKKVVLAVKLYKHISNRCRIKPLFLHRNLLFVIAQRHEALPSLRFDERAPSVWPKAPRHKRRPSVTFSQRKHRVEGICNIIGNENCITSNIPSYANPVHYSFCVDTLYRFDKVLTESDDATLATRELFRDSRYRSHIKRSCPNYVFPDLDSFEYDAVPDYRLAPAKTEDGSILGITVENKDTSVESDMNDSGRTRLSFLETSNSSSSVIAEAEYRDDGTRKESPVTMMPAVFSLTFEILVNDKLLAGRHAKVSVYTVSSRFNDDNTVITEKPISIPNAEFAMKTNKRIPGLVVDIMMPSYSNLNSFHILIKVMFTGLHDSRRRDRIQQDMLKMPYLYREELAQEPKIPGPPEDVDIVYHSTMYGVHEVWRRSMKGKMRNTRVVLKLIDDAHIHLRDGMKPTESDDIIQHVAELHHMYEKGPYLRMQLGPFDPLLEESDRSESEQSDLCDDTKPKELTELEKKVMRTLSRERSAGSTDSTDDSEKRNRRSPIPRAITHEDIILDDVSTHLEKAFGKPLSEIQEDQELCHKLNGMLQLHFPEQIEYRIRKTLGLNRGKGSASTESGSLDQEIADYISGLEKNEDKYFWKVSKVNKETHRCIICNRWFANVFSLLQHYRCNYPRLAVLYDIDMMSSMSNRIVFDVVLDTGFEDVVEVLSPSINGPVHLPYDPSSMFFVTPYQSWALRSNWRMNLTSFLDIQVLPSTIHYRSHVRGKFFHPLTMAQFGLAEKQYDYHHGVPPVNVNLLHHRCWEELADFVDMDAEEKEFMLTWDRLAFQMGKYNFGIAKHYCFARIFLIIYEEECKGRFLEMVISTFKHLLEHNMISIIEYKDLKKRLMNPDYNPLADKDNIIRRRVEQYCRDKFLLFSEKPLPKNGKIEPKKTMLQRLLFQNTDISSMKEQEKIEFMELLLRTYRRFSRRPHLMTTVNDPVRMAFGQYHNGVIPVSLRNLRPFGLSLVEERQSDVAPDAVVSMSRETQRLPFL